MTYADDVQQTIRDLRTRYNGLTISLFDEDYGHRHVLTAVYEGRQAQRLELLGEWQGYSASEIRAWIEEFLGKSPGDSTS